jgi:phospholipase C
VSPWSRSSYVSNVVHDHTSILSFIETKWNLPAMTMRDANADNLLDFFDFSSPAFATPPQLAAPKNPAVSDVACSTADPNRPIEPYPGGQRPANPIVLPSTAPTGVPEYPLAALAGAGAALGAFMRRRAQAGDRQDPRTGA